MSSKRCLIFFTIPLLLLLTFAQSLPTQIRGIAYTNVPTVMASANGTISSGLAYDIFNKICSQLNISVVYAQGIDIMLANRSALNYIANGTYDFILGFPIFPTDDDFGDEFENISKMAIIRDSIIIFTPNLLQLLVVGVLKELFFVFVIILLPWFLICTTLYYLIEIRRFSNMYFFSGFWEAFLMITWRKKKMPKGAKIYSAFFFTATLVVTMLLLGDFIYVIASLLLKSDIDNINDSVNQKSSVCILQNDYLSKNFLKNRPEIRYSQTSDPVTCFIELNSFDVGSFIVSGTRIKNFFLTTPSQNNMFDFDIRDSVALDYYVLLRNDLDHLHSIMAPIFEELEVTYITTVSKKYETQPVFNKIVPSSIFSDSILLIFTSLTITSTFLILFLIIMIYSQRKPPGSRKSKKYKKFKDEKARRYQLATQHDRYSQQVIMENEDGSNNRYEGDPYYQQEYPQENNRVPVNPRNTNTIKNRTLSLTGPIQHHNFEGKPDKNMLKIEIKSSNEEGNGTDDFENQLSPIPKAEESENQTLGFEIEGGKTRTQNEQQQVKKDD